MPIMPQVLDVHLCQEASTIPFVSPLGVLIPDVRVLRSLHATVGCVETCGGVICFVLHVMGIESEWQKLLCILEKVSLHVGSMLAMHLIEVKAFNVGVSRVSQSRSPLGVSACNMWDSLLHCTFYACNLFQS